MYADNLALRSGLQTEGIVVAQVLLRGEGQLLDVLYGLNVIRANVQLLQFITVEGHVMVHVLYNLVKSLTLERAHLVAAHTFFVRIPNHCLFSFILLITHDSIFSSVSAASSSSAESRSLNSPLRAIEIDPVSSETMMQRASLSWLIPRAARWRSPNSFGMSRS